MRRLIILALLLPVLAVAQVVSFVSSPSAAAPESGLSNGLIAFWKFDGNWNDSKGSNTLTPNGGAHVSATGKSGQAASFELDSTQYAYINDNADLSISETQNFTIAAWVKTESSVNQTICEKVITSATSFEYRMLIRSSNTCRSYIGTSVATTAQSTSPGTWYFIAIWYNASTDSAYVQLNNNSPTRVAVTSGPSDTANQFTVGGKDVGYYFDGLIDDLGFWKRSGNAITGKAFVDSLYNAGAGWRP